MTGPATSEAIVFFTRPGCPWSVALRRRVERLRLPVEYRDIWEDPEAAAFVRSVDRGHETVPTVRVGGVALVNPSIGRLLDVMRREVPHLVPESETKTDDTSAVGRVVRFLRR